MDYPTSSGQYLQRIRTGIQRPDKHLVIGLADAFGHGGPFHLLDLQGDAEFFQIRHGRFIDAGAPGYIGRADGLLNLKAVFIARFFHELFGFFQVEFVFFDLGIERRRGRRQITAGRKRFALEELLDDQIGRNGMR